MPVLVFGPAPRGGFLEDDPDPPAAWAPLANLSAALLLATLADDGSCFK